MDKRGHSTTIWCLRLLRQPQSRPKWILALKNQTEPIKCRCEDNTNDADKQCNSASSHLPNSWSCRVHALVSPTKKAEPPPTRDVNRDSGTASANGGWRLVRRHHREPLSKTHCFMCMSASSLTFRINSNCSCCESLEASDCKCC